MEPKIVTTSAKTLIVKRINMSLVQNNTPLLWQGFMQSKYLIPNPKNNLLYSIQLYPENYFAAFNPNTFFDKLAGIEVDINETPPADMEKFELAGGTYAVFSYKGSNANATTFFNFIFTQWLPNSDYILDNRPHFEVLGEKYKNNSPDSEEEVWIPVQPKG